MLYTRDKMIYNNIIEIEKEKERQMTNLTKDMTSSEIHRFLLSLIDDFESDYNSETGEGNGIKYSLRHPTATSHYFQEELEAEIIIDCNGITIKESYILNQGLVNTSSETMQTQMIFNLLQFGFVVYAVEEFQYD